MSVVSYWTFVSYWTAGFEAMYHYLKYLAHVTGNFTNICFSLHNTNDNSAFNVKYDLHDSLAPLYTDNVRASPDSPVLYSLITFNPQ